MKPATDADLDPQTGEENDYSGPVSNTDEYASFTDAAGLIFHREAAGVVEAIAPTVQTTGAGSSFNIQYQGDLIVGKLAMGCASLRTSVAGAFVAS